MAQDVQSRNGKVPREIERKFLLKRLPPNLRHFHSRTIEQGYLSVKTDGTQIRLRKSGRRHSLTIKRGRGLSRQEIEIDLTRDQFEELLENTRLRSMFIAAETKGWSLRKLNSGTSANAGSFNRRSGLRRK